MGTGFRTRSRAKPRLAPARDIQHRAGDVGRRVRQKKQNRLGDFVRLPRSAQRGLPTEVLQLPDPAAAQLLGADPQQSFVVGDSVWDLLAAQRARALGIGLLSGGYGREELERAGAYRVYADTADMFAHIEEVGVRPLR